MSKLNPLGGRVGFLVLASLLPLGASCATPGESVEVLALLETRPGNPAVTVDGRILFSQHPLDAPEFKVVELRENGDVVPFPSSSWSRDRLGAVIGIEARSNGLVWILDMGGGGISPKLMAWDALNDTLAHQHQIPAPARVEASFLQDLAVVERYGIVVIADMTLPGPFATPEPALIVVDIETGAARRVLQGHASFMPTLPDVTIEDPRGNTRLAALTDGGDVRALKLGLNGISVDPSQDWIYFGCVSGESVFRIPTAALANPELAQEDLGAMIEVYGDKGPSDGLRVDGQGRVFVTDLEQSGIGIATPDGYELVVSGTDLYAWPDGLAFDQDGSLIVTVNQLHRHPSLNGGKHGGTVDYVILRLNDLKAQR